MCHLMPQRHLPEWREEDERAFVHHGIWISNKGLDNTMPAIINCICIKWRTALWKALWQTRLDEIAWFKPELPQCTNARSSSLHSGRCRCRITWHMPLLWVAQFPYVYQPDVSDLEGKVSSMNRINFSCRCFTFILTFLTVTSFLAVTSSSFPVILAIKKFMYTYAFLFLFLILIL